jgi:lysozyme family protein
MEDGGRCQCYGSSGLGRYKPNHEALEVTFVDAFRWVVGEEGNLSLDPTDRGNWTGGQINEGELKGTKYGISAAAYPDLDIQGLTVEQAAAIAKPDYWDKIRGDEIPYPAALQMLDFGYNAGAFESIKVMQRALDLDPIDGKLGPQTLAAICNIDQLGLRAFNTQRILAYMRMPGYPVYGAGWRARSAATLAEALRTWALLSQNS